MKTLIALTVLVAAAMPALAGSDPEALVNGKCQPIAGNPGGSTLVIGTVLSVRDDPAHRGTDIVLDQIVPTAQVSTQIRDGRIVAVSNAGWFKAVTPTYVGKKVIMWDGPDPHVPGVFDVNSLMLFCNPS
jgi:hypothetical protein